MEINEFSNTLSLILEMKKTPWILCSYNPILMDNSLERFANDEGDLGFNLSPTAIRSPKLDRETHEFSFKASFKGVVKEVVIPVAAIKECCSLEED